MTAAPILAPLLARVQTVADRAAEAALVARLAAADGATTVAFLNQHACNVACTQPGFAALLAGADVLLRDGVGAELALLATGRPAGLNMVGTSFIPLLVASFAGRPAALYGTAMPWTAQAAAALGALGPLVVCVEDGFQPDDLYVVRTREHAPHLVILGMGMPKQERVAAAIAVAATAPVVIVNGGAIADYLAGRFSRAPGWMRRARLEWVFRLALEPRRLARRYLVGGPAFLWRLGQLRFSRPGRIEAA